MAEIVHQTLHLRIDNAHEYRVCVDCNATIKYMYAF